jgi:hypothetical protein
MGAPIGNKNAAGPHKGGGLHKNTGRELKKLLPSGHSPNARPMPLSKALKFVHKAEKIAKKKAKRGRR